MDWDFPYKVLYGTDPDLGVLRPFGCLAYLINSQPTRDKFDSRSHKCIFLEYDAHHKCYLLFDLVVSKILVSRDVNFNTSTFSFTDTNTTSPIHSPTKLGPTFPSSPSPLDSLNQTPPGHDFSSDSVDDLESVLHQNEDDLGSPDHQQGSSSTLTHDDDPVRRGSRKRKPPVWMNDYTGHLVAFSVLEESTGLTPPTFPYDISPSFTITYTEFLFNLTSTQVPNSFKEVSTSKDWVHAMETELQALEDNKT